MKKASGSDHQFTHHLPHIPSVLTDDPYHAPSCPYLTFVQHISVASVTLMDVWSKQKSSELVLKPTRVEERQGRFHWQIKHMERWREDEKRFGGNTRLCGNQSTKCIEERMRTVSKVASKCNRHKKNRFHR